MKFAFCVGFLACLYVFTFGVDLDERCKNKPDGNHEIGCRAYLKCTNGTGEQIHCPEGEVYNLHTEQCDDPLNSPPPCGMQMDCSHLDDGRYPDLYKHCAFYYTCQGGAFLGYNPCPAGLVFNETLEICDWAHNVLPPCGYRED